MKHRASELHAPKLKRPSPKRARTQTSLAPCPCGRPCSAAVRRFIRLLEFEVKSPRRGPLRLHRLKRVLHSLHIMFLRDVPFRPRRGRFPLPARPGPDKCFPVLASRCPSAFRRGRLLAWRPLPWFRLPRPQLRELRVRPISPTELRKLAQEYRSVRRAKRVIKVALLVNPAPRPFIRVGDSHNKPSGLLPDSRPSAQSFHLAPISPRS
jgi:hypothetical protein